MTAVETNLELERLLEYLKQARHFDFTGYKRLSLKRRIDKRMDIVGIDSYVDYTDYLEVHPEEFVALFNTVLINVTAFFRDAAAWDYLSTEIVPRLVARKGKLDAIRVWSAGCASGEEAYTLAMVFAEKLGVDECRDTVKIYATDVDEEALGRARHATYGSKELEGLPDGYLEKYFERVDSRYIFRKDLRRTIIFGRHDLIQDAPISRIDLLCCRNCLMYFNSETQSRILSRFHFALSDGGCLFLGRAEMLFSYSTMFTAVDLRRRIFMKSAKGDMKELAPIAKSIGSEGNNSAESEQARACVAGFEASPASMIVVDVQGRVRAVSEKARAMFSLTLHDVGRPLQDLEISYRPVELRSYIEQVQNERRAVTIKDVQWPLKSGEPRWLDVQVGPLLDRDNGLLGSIVSASDVTRFRHLQEELERSNQELETAYEELQSTNEELETTNEELQSTVEELETTNEELQSTNEELETMNEEMQSTNEELHAINDELRLRGDELNHVNAFLEGILTSLRGGVAVVDMDSRVQVWNRRAEDLWGLRPSEVQGRNLLMLDCGLPVAELRRPLRACLSGESELQEILLRATSRLGKSILCKVTCVPLVGASSEVQGAILVMEELPDERANSVQANVEPKPDSRTPAEPQ